jgi:hypothetical protein
LIEPRHHTEAEAGGTLNVPLFPNLLEPRWRIFQPIDLIDQEQEPDLQRGITGFEALSVEIDVG